MPLGLKADVSRWSRCCADLGLSITKHLDETMHGGIGVELDLPSGASFWFTLPRSLELGPTQTDGAEAEGGR